MARVKIDPLGNLTTPTFILQNRRFENVGYIGKIFNKTYKENFNSANEFTGVVYKKTDDFVMPDWDKIETNRIVYSPELQERFVLQTPTTEDKSVYKQITAKSLCESELSQINLYNVEINTETDIQREDYNSKEPTTFYNPTNPKASILNRVLEKAPHYQIRHVDESLINNKKIVEFSFNDKDIYSILTGDIAEEFNCIFIFDSMNRFISVYDLYNTCNKCGYRGDFTDKCPECGSTDFGGKYGKDTTVFISSKNLASSITLEPDMDSLKNCFYVEGGDDIINAAIRSINPNGSNYIYYFNEDTTADMSDKLKDVLNSYNELYDEYNSTHEYHLEPETCQKYNSQVQYVWDLFDEDSDYGENIAKLPSTYTLVGYPPTTDAMYNAINLYYILKTSMMPTIDTDGESIEDSMKAIINGFRNGFVSKADDTPFPDQIAVNNSTLASQSDVERAIEKTARIFYGTAYYDFEVITNSYTKATSTSTGTWIGQFKLTSLTETDENGNKISVLSDEFNSSNFINLAVIENNELYTQQEIARAISKKDELSEKQISNIHLSIDYFKKQLHYYSLDELNNIADMFQSCKDVLITTDEASDMDDALLKKYEDLYTERITYTNLEKVEREKQIDYVKNVYYPGSSKKDDVPSGVLYELRSKVNAELNIEKYIKLKADETTWNEFCSYRREDKYSNEYYISEGMTDSEIVEKSKELLDVAKKQLYKAGTLQYSISATLSNLLAMEEFKPFAKDFEVGNWIRVEIDGKICQLRLLSYQTDFSDVSKLSVEFSTVENISNGYSDIESVLNSASSMASSYPSVVQQMDSTTSKADKVNNLVSGGLNATRTKFVDSDNEEIVIDNHGLLARHYDYITNTYDSCQVKLLANGLYTTSDGWLTIDTGIGKISYKDPETGKWINDYGMIAKTIIGKLIISEKLKIYGANNSIILDDNGITLDGGAIKWKKKLPSSSVDGLDEELAQQLELAEQGIKDAANALSQANSAYTRAENAETNSKKYTDTQDSILSTNLTTAYENYANSKVKDLDDKVSDYLGIGGTTIISDDYVVSPYIGGGYLNIASGNKRVIIDPKNLGKTGYIFQIHNDSEISVGIDSSGNATFNGIIKAKSIDLSSCTNKVSTDYISGLSSVATSGNYNDLSNKPPIPTSVSDLGLDPNTIIYKGDITQEQKTDTNGNTYLLTTVPTSSGNISYSTYDVGDYVVFGREKGENFVLSKEGLLTAKNAVIYGTVYATDGYFTGDIKSGSTITCGDNFSVTSEGLLTAKNAVIYGSINNTNRKTTSAGITGTYGIEINGGDIILTEKDSTGSLYSSHTSYITCASRAGVSYSTFPMLRIYDSLGGVDIETGGNWTDSYGNTQSSDIVMNTGYDISGDVKNTPFLLSSSLGMYLNKVKEINRNDFDTMIKNKVVALKKSSGSASVASGAVSGDITISVPDPGVSYSNVIPVVSSIEMGVLMSITNTGSPITSVTYKAKNLTTTTNTIKITVLFIYTA